MASFADDLADIARPRSMEYVAGMAEGNEFGANAKRLARLIGRAEVSIGRLIALVPHPITDMVIEEMRAAIAEARR